MNDKGALYINISCPSLVYCKVVYYPLCGGEIARIRDHLRARSRTTGSRVRRISPATADSRVENEGMVVEVASQVA